LSKVFGKIIYERLLQHVEVNNNLVEEQFGFRPVTSTEKASYRLINEILNVMNERKVVGEIFCDLQKAFNCVNYTISLAKLEWRLYTQKRFQIIICNSNSEWGEIRHGVPQKRFAKNS
jgi:hypothetical protein